MTTPDALDALGHLGYAAIYLGQVLLARRSRAGWVLRLAGTALWLGIGLALGLSSVWVWSAIGLGIDARGWWSWRRPGPALEDARRRATAGRPV